MKRPLALAFGLFVSSCGTGSGSDSGVETPTFYKDVMPITQQSCGGCHTEGGIAPFAMDTYEQVKAHAPNISSAVESRRMPPWLASDDCGGPFVNNRRLSDAQIDTIKRWAAEGAPAGNEADKPAPVDRSAESLAKVDFEATMPEAYTPTLRDDYRCFIIDPKLTSEKVVTGYDITPGSNSVVHHVIMYVVPREKALQKDAEDATAGWQCFGGANTTTTGTIGAWAPGGSAITFPRNTGIALGKDSVIALQVHYNTDNAHDSDRTTVKLMFGAGTETRAYLIPLVADNFDIPPGAVGYKHSEDFKNELGFPIKVWGFLPHMHTRGKKISITGGADNACQVDIKAWDFHWQSQYFRKTALAVPDQSKLSINCEWDNPGSEHVYWGEGTSDEMCFAFVFATP